MLNYFLFTVICSMVFMFHKKLGLLFMIVGVFYFLLVLPTTGQDYDVYKQAYDQAYFSAQYPWFFSRTVLTSEPFYLWYNSFWGVILPLEFPGYLAINFLVCVLISKAVFRKLRPDNFAYYWMMFLPVIIPTIFYFSPRSSISFIFIFAGMMSLVHKRYWLAIFLLFLGCITHSQFLLIAFLIGITCVMFFRVNNDTNKYLRIIMISSMVLFVLLNFMNQISSTIVSFLSFLPSVGIIASKMHYFESEGGSENFRITAILSIFIYPLLSYKLLKLITSKDENLIFLSSVTKKSEILFTYLLFALIVYGGVINISFISDPHVAGRLSRFSDYVGMGFVFPLFITLMYGEQALKWIVLFFCLLAPILFATLYVNVDWRIF